MMVRPDSFHFEMPDVWYWNTKTGQKTWASFFGALLGAINEGIGKLAVSAARGRRQTSGPGVL